MMAFAPCSAQPRAPLKLHSAAAVQMQGSGGKPAKYLELLPPGSGQKQGDGGREPETALGCSPRRTGAGGCSLIRFPLPSSLPPWLAPVYSLFLG